MGEPPADVSNGPRADKPLRERLAAAVRRRYGSAVRVAEVAPMAGGHAGFTIGLRVIGAEGETVERLVVKRGPPGVHRAGVADIFRQATLLRALHAYGLPVPPLVWAEAGEEEIGSPYIVMRWVEGREHFPLVVAPARHDAPFEERLWRLAVDTLAELASFPWRDYLSDWEAPVAIGAELGYWEATLRKSPEPEWIGLGLRARDALAARVPKSEPIALIHGDYQPANLLLRDGRVSAIVDWDLAGLRSALVDIGWLMMFADREYWGPHWETTCPVPVAELARAYAIARGIAPEEVGWYHAFAGYRFGAISCLNVRLHRSGRRPDPVWERFALDVPRLFARANQLADQVG